jgi:cytochrome c oxidase subunit I+III
VSDRYPLWNDPAMERAVDRGRWYLPGTQTGGRETIVTSPIEGEPQYLMRVAGPGLAPVLAAAFTAAFFLILTVKLITVALICGVIAIGSILYWCWQLDLPPAGKVSIGGRIRLPTYVSGPNSHAWWAMIVLMIVAGALYLSYVFSYLYTWTVSPGLWPSSQALPGWLYPVLTLSLLALSSAAISQAGRRLSASTSPAIWSAIVVLAVILLCVALATDAYAFWSSGLRPSSNAYMALVALGLFLQLQLVSALVVMAGFAIARKLTGQLNSTRRVVYDNVMQLWHYTTAQGALGVILMHGFPRVL